jgi:hypothetical protein
MISGKLNLWIILRTPILQMHNLITYGLMDSEEKNVFKYATVMFSIKQNIMDIPVYSRMLRRTVVVALECHQQFTDSKASRSFFFCFCLPL